MMLPTRIKVRIHCRRCGENFILKGIKTKGHVDTGFKRCLCNNEGDLDIEEMP